MQMRTRIFEKRKDLMEELNAYISPVDPEWIGKLRPSEPGKLEELQKYLGMQEENIQLPESFLKFADYAGESDSGLLSDTLKGKFSISELTDMAKNVYEFEPQDIDPYNIEFLWDEVGIEYIMDLKNDGKISYGGSYYVSSSFENLLFQCAVRKFEERYFSENLCIGYNRYFSFRQKESLDMVLKEFIHRNHMHSVWFNDEYFLFAYNQKCSIILEQPEMIKGKISVWGKIFGDDRDKMLKELSPQIGAEVDWIEKLNKKRIK